MSSKEFTVREVAYARALERLSGRALVSLVRHLLPNGDSATRWYLTTRLLDYAQVVIGAQEDEHPEN